jgi:hypothetical protein
MKLTKQRLDTADAPVPYQSEYTEYIIDNYPLQPIPSNIGCNVWEAKYKLGKDIIRPNEYPRWTNLFRGLICGTRSMISYTYLHGDERQFTDFWNFLGCVKCGGSSIFSENSMYWKGEKEQPEYMQRLFRSTRYVLYTHSSYTTEFFLEFHMPNIVHKGISQDAHGSAGYIFPSELVIKHHYSNKIELKEFKIVKGISPELDAEFKRFVNEYLNHEEGLDF